MVANTCKLHLRVVKWHSIEWISKCKQPTDRHSIRNTLQCSAMQSRQRFSQSTNLNYRLQTQDQIMHEKLIDVQDYCHKTKIILKKLTSKQIPPHQLICHFILVKFLNQNCLDIIVIWVSFSMMFIGITGSASSFIENVLVIKTVILQHHSTSLSTILLGRVIISHSLSLSSLHSIFNNWISKIQVMA